MTPAEKMGLKVGDKVRVLGEAPGGFPVGEEIHLFYDDGTDMPKFRKGELTLWVELSNIIPIPTRTTVTGPATVTVAAGETITFEGNATVKQDWVPKFGDRVVFVEPPSDMVGEFGVVLSGDGEGKEYCIAYNDGYGADERLRQISEIKPYEAE